VAHVWHTYKGYRYATRRDLVALAKGAALKMRFDIDLNIGTASFDLLGDTVRVGDYLVPTLVYVLFPGADGQPELTMTIDSSTGLSRCSDLRLRAKDSSSEVRGKDLRAVEIESWIEMIMPLTVAHITSSGPGGTEAAFSAPDSDSEHFRSARNSLRDSRRAGRTRGGEALASKVADVYLAHPDAPREAVERAFGVSRRTAFRYIAQARDLIDAANESEGS